MVGKCSFGVWGAAAEAVGVVKAVLNTITSLPDCHPDKPLPRNLLYSQYGAIVPLNL